VKVAVRFDPRFAGLCMWLYEDKPDGRYVVEPMSLVIKRFDHGVDVEPTFRFEEHNGEEFLQSLVNALVSIGYKPDEVKASDKQVEAIKYHLEDMRRLVFKEEGNGD